MLDVPSEALAQRIAAVGTDSRPLLHNEPGDPYTKALKRLSYLFKPRGKNYAKANAMISLEGIADKLGYRDVSDITPTKIAIEALDQIEAYLKKVAWPLQDYSIDFDSDSQSYLLKDSSI